MKTLFYSLALITLLSSCSKYQMSMISSTNTVKDDETGRFKMENDSVKIIYSFYGRNAPMHIDITNKLNEPLYIDWQRSALIANGKAVSLANKSVQINGDVSGTSFGTRNVQFTDGTLTGTATLPENIAFVPPHAQIEKTLIEVNAQMPSIIADDAFKKGTLPTNDLQTESNVKIAEFNRESSPLSFKSYLSLYTIHDNTPKYTAVQNEFFVSKIIRSGTTSPQSFEFFQAGRGDYFYTSQVTKYGIISTGVVGVAALAGAAALNNSVAK